jgi:hypothetical protein
MPQEKVEWTTQINQEMKELERRIQALELKEKGR